MSELSPAAPAPMTTPNPCGPREQQLRADYLEALYANSGRCCSTYTGLYRARAHQLLEIDRAELLLQAAQSTNSDD